MTTLTFQAGSKIEAVIVDKAFGELSTIRCDVIGNEYMDQEYDLVELKFISPGEKPSEARLLKGEAEKLRDYLNMILPEMKGNV